MSHPPRLQPMVYGLWSLWSMVRAFRGFTDRHHPLAPELQGAGQTVQTVRNTRNPLDNTRPSHQDFFMKKFTTRKFVVPRWTSGQPYCWAESLRGRCECALRIGWFWLIGGCSLS